MIKEDLNQLNENIEKEIKEATDLKQLNEIKVKVFGKAGALTNLSKGMRDVPVAEKPVIGALINEVRKNLENKFNNKENEFKQAELLNKLESERIDSPTEWCGFIIH